MLRTLFYSIFFVALINLIIPSYGYKGDAYYDSIYKESSILVQDSKTNKAIILLKEINSHYKYSLYHKTNINAHYDLGQIYLSMISDYDLAVNHFEFIFKNIHYRPFKDNKETKQDFSLRSLDELRFKSLFMLGYIHHNHLGNFTKAEKYYKLFLDQYKDSDLASSVVYELELIQKAIDDFNNK